MLPPSLRRSPIERTPLSLPIRARGTPALFALVSLVGCNALISFDDLRYDDEPGPGSTTAVGSSSGGAGAGGGAGATSSGATGGHDTGGRGPVALWARQFGGASDERLAGLEAGDGSIVIAGSYRGAPTFGPTPLPDMAVMYQPGPFGIFAATLDGDGAPAWSRGFGDAHYDHVANGVSASSEAIVVAGSFQGQFDFASSLTAQGTDAYAFALAADGTEVWSDRFGGSGQDRAYGLAAGASGIVMTGDYDSPATFGTFGLNAFGATDIFVARLDKAGAVVGATGFGDGAPQYGRAAALDERTERFAIAGFFWNHLRFDGSCAELVSAGGNDLFIAVFGNAGCIWARRMGDAADQIDTSRGPEKDAAPHLAFRPSGNLVVAGAFSGAADFGGGVLAAAGECPFVAEYSMDGGHVFSATFTCLGASAVHAMRTTDAETLLAGAFDTSVDFGGGVLDSAGNRDAFVARLTTAGNHVWSGRFGDASDQRATGVALTAQGETLLGGDFAGTIDFGGGALVNPDGSGNTTDVFVAKFPQ
jgi:hypothetical protein